MKSKTKMAVGVLAAMLVATTVYAALIAHWDIETTMRIKRTVSISVCDVDGTTPLTAINFGDCTWQSAKMFPGGLDYTGLPPPELYFIKNTDQTDFYVGFSVDPPISGVEFRLWIKRGDQTNWQELMVGQVYQYPMVSPVNDPNPDVQFAHWYLAIHIAEPAFGDYASTLAINAFDSA